MSKHVIVFALGIINENDVNPQRFPNAGFSIKESSPPK